jgi:hypothetical protein
MTRYAKDYQCNVDGCNKQAVVFVGLNDPDATEYPKCREHADQWKIDTMMALQEIRTKEPHA